MEIDDLIARLEAATEGSRELDAEIDAALTGWHPAHLCSDITRRSYGPGFVHRLDDGSSLLSKDGRTSKQYTTSLDAALTLYKKRPEQIPSDPLKACVEALCQW